MKIARTLSILVALFLPAAAIASPAVRAACTIGCCELCPSSPCPMCPR